MIRRRSASPARSAPPSALVGDGGAAVCGVVHLPPLRPFYGAGEGFTEAEVDEQASEVDGAEIRGGLKIFGLGHHTILGS